MDENKSITYDDLIQTRNTQILKSIVPYLDVPAQKPLAMLIQLMEWKNATAAFSMISKTFMFGGQDRMLP